MTAPTVATPTGPTPWAMLEGREVAVHTVSGKVLWHAVGEGINEVIYGTIAVAAMGSMGVIAS